MRHDEKCKTRPDQAKGRGYLEDFSDASREETDRPDLKDGHHQSANHKDRSHFFWPVVELRLCIEWECRLKDRKPELGNERHTEEWGESSRQPSPICLLLFHARRLCGQRLR